MELQSAESEWCRRVVFRTSSSSEPSQLPAWLALIAAVLAQLSAQGALAETWFVDATAPEGGDGLAWSSAFQSPVDALDVATAGDQIRVSQGAYPPTAGTDREASFVIPPGVSLVGGYAGLSSSDPDERNTVAFPTTLSGEIGSSGPSDNSWHVVRVVGEGQPRVLDGFIIRDGNASGDQGEGEGANMGGGILSLGGPLVVLDCVIRENASTSGGAGIYSDGPLTLESCTVTSNTVPSSGGGDGAGVYQNGASLDVMSSVITLNDGSGAAGGGLFTLGADVVIQSSQIRRNDADYGAGAAFWFSDVSLVDSHFVENPPLTVPPASQGGAVEVTWGVLDAAFCGFVRNSASRGGGVFAGGESTFESCAFVLNTADQDGGGVYVHRPSTFVDCEFTANSAAAFNADGGGGAFVATLGVTTQRMGVFTRCSFVDNESDVLEENARGGGVLTKGRCDLVACRLLGNLAWSGGGAAVQGSGRITMASSFLSGNVASSEGGGVFSDGGHVGLYSVTLSGNSAGEEGAGVVVKEGDDGIPLTRISNSILWGNGGSTAGYTDQLRYVAFGSPIVRFSTIQGVPIGSVTGEQNSGVDPQLLLPAGRDGQFGTADDSAELAPGSPAIDSGATPRVVLDATDADEDGVTAELLPIDVNGDPRFQDRPEPDGSCSMAGAVDRGAQEMPGEVQSALPGDLDADGTLSPRDLGLLLSAWGICPDACCVADLDGDGVVNLLDLVLFFEVIAAIEDQSQ